MLTPAVELNFCCNVLTTTSWPCCNCVAEVAALLCWLRNCCMNPVMVPVNGADAERGLGRVGESPVCQLRIEEVRPGGISGRSRRRQAIDRKFRGIAQQGR